MATARAHMVPAMMPARKTWVEIRRSANEVGVTSEHVFLRKSEGDEVEWFSQGAAYTVLFDTEKGSPFADNEFHVSKQGSAGSGPIVVTPKSQNGESYKYSILDANKKKVVDPDVIIRP